MEEAKTLDTAVRGMPNQNNLAQQVILIRDRYHRAAQCREEELWDQVVSLEQEANDLFDKVAREILPWLSAASRRILGHDRSLHEEAVSCTMERLLLEIRNLRKPTKLETNFMACLALHLHQVKVELRRSNPERPSGGKTVQTTDKKDLQLSFIEGDEQREDNEGRSLSKIETTVDRRALAKYTDFIGLHAFEQIVKQLPQKPLKAFELYLEGKDFSQIGSILEINRDTASAHVKQCQDIIKRELRV